MEPAEKLDHLCEQIQIMWNAVRNQEMGHQNLMSAHAKTAETLQEIATEVEGLRDKVYRAIQS
jgi:hypothetical protein